MNFEIPPGLTDLLQEFTVAVLRARPSNLESFAAEYFNNLNEKKNGGARSGGLRFAETEPQKFENGSDNYSDEDSDGEPERKIFFHNLDFKFK